MSNPKDTIMITFTRDEVHLLYEVVTRDEYVANVEDELVGDGDPECLTASITERLTEALSDEEEDEEDNDAR